MSMRMCFLDIYYKLFGKHNFDEISDIITKETKVSCISPFNFRHTGYINKGRNEFIATTADGIGMFGCNIDACYDFRIEV